MSVAVLLSTYNGEKFVIEQIKSIFNQIDVDITLYVRDDGSTDTTLDILEELSKQFNIIIIKGENKGWKRSYKELLNIVPITYDYYAFSDQDDVWLDDKIISSIKQIENNNIPSLCCSAQTLVDRNLNILYDDVHAFPQNNREAMTNISCRGCTEVFNRQLLLLLKMHDPQIDFAHDRWVARVAICLGIIYFDSTSKILYRQHELNSAGNNYKVGIKEKFKRAIQNYRDKDFYYWYAKEILSGYNELLTEDIKRWLTLLVKADSDFFAKMKLLFSKDFVSETVMGTFLLKIIMILGLYQ